MSQEMFYTSAPKGLQPGSRGFCTVAATRGMSPALLEKLESLSGYRPLFPPHDARAALNPVTFAHVRVTVGGRVFPVLSRVGPAGLDYTERPNKFAHHVVLEVGELPAAGPAWLLSQPGFMEARWDGQVGFLPAGRTPPDGSMEADTGRAWQALTGDASQRNMLAEAFRADPSRLVYLLFEPGMDLLPLLAESLASLTPEQRWEVTFSTYFTGLPQGVQCLWRCVPHGAPEAKGARQGANALVIDLAAMRPERVGAMAAKARREVVVPPPLAGKEVNWPGQEGDNSGDNAAWQEKPNTNRKAQFLAAPPPVPYTSELVERHGTSWKKIWFSGLGLGLVIGFIISVGIVGIGHYRGFFRTEQLSQAVEQREKEIEELKANIKRQEQTLAEMREKKSSDGVRNVDLPIFGASTVGLLSSLGGQGPLLAASSLIPGRARNGHENFLETIKRRLALAMKMAQTEDKGKAAEGDHKPPKPTSQSKEKDETSQAKDDTREKKNEPRSLGKSEFQELKELAKKPKNLSLDERKAMQGLLKKLETGVYDRLTELKKQETSADAQLTELEDIRKTCALETVKYYYRLPTSNIKEARSVELPDELKKITDWEHWKIELCGSKKLEQKFDGKSLKIHSAKKNQNPPVNVLIATFTKLEGPKLTFKWGEPGDKGGEEARRLVRNAVLKIFEENGKKVYYVGLMRLENDAQNKFPWKVDFAKLNSKVFERNSEEQLESEIYLSYVRCEMSNQMRMLRSVSDTAKLEWDSRIVLRIRKKDDKPSEYQLTVDWLGDEGQKPASFILHSFVAYTKVGDQRVEVWRVGEEKK